MAGIAAVARHEQLPYTIGPGGNRRKLSEAEAAFVAAAAALILPEPLHAGIEVDAVEFLEGLFASDSGCCRELATAPNLTEPDDGAAVVLDQYRGGVAAVQRYCVAAHGRPFQELRVRDKHLILSLLEDGCSEAGFEKHAAFFRLLVLHASEAYFDKTQISLRIRHA